MKPNKKQVGRRINQIREKDNLTLEDFGKSLGKKLGTERVKEGIISRWENGISLPNSKRIKAIAELGEMTVDELLYGSSVKSYIINLLSTDDDYDYNDPIQKKATDDTISCFDDTNLSNAEMNIVNVYIQNLNYYEGNSNFRIHDRETYLEFLEISSRSIKEQIENITKEESTNEKISWNELSNEEKLLIMENDFQRKRNSVLNSIYESNQRLIQKLNRKD